MEDNNNKPQNQKLNIELSEEIAEGIYANLAIITHSNAEFVIDYVRMLPGVPKAKVKSRILLTPLHAKKLLKALNENIARYEKTFGVITENTQQPEGFYPVNFGGPKYEA
ncbi:MAG: DUF3467 domain-containing protein [Luteibaculaceae bacterium]